MDVLLLSTYELGHQPLGGQDLAVEHLDDTLVREADLVGISVPMHTATRLGVRLAERVRTLNERCHVSFYGLYASLHADVLLGRLADSVVGGEFETPLVELAARLDDQRWMTDVGRSTTKDAQAAVGRPSSVVFLGRQEFELPRRDLLPPLQRYARVDTGARQKLVGYVEASRGCAHRCLHCPITPVYGGRLRVVGQDVVLEDIRQLVAMGAEHITFGDPDFFNGIRHSLRIVEAMHAEFPSLTYDATIKIEHILEQTGCLFVVSAVEAVQDHILENFRKGHTAADVEEALAITASVGIVLRPTFVAFTPWTSLDDYLGLLEFIDRHNLVGHVDPIQLAIRLLVPRGSSLIGTPAMDPFLRPFDEATFSHRWRHPDPRVDRLQKAASDAVAQAVGTEQTAEAIFDQVYNLALGTAGRPGRAPDGRPPRSAGAVPRLTEPWFC